MSSLETAINAFLNNITDIELRSDQTEVTVNKDIKAEQLCVAIRTVMARVELKYGKRSAKYKIFRTDGLARQSNPDLLITGKRVVRVGTEFLPILTENGLKTTMLTSITTLCNEFENLIIDLKIKMGERDVMQEERVKAGNAIYQTLLKYTTIGLRIWETKDVAKYNDYLIYNIVKVGTMGVTVEPVV